MFGKRAWDGVGPVNAVSPWPTDTAHLGMRRRSSAGSTGRSKTKIHLANLWLIPCASLKTPVFSPAKPMFGYVSPVNHRIALREVDCALTNPGVHVLLSSVTDGDTVLEATNIRR